jgi:hypothetical protein
MDDPSIVSRLSLNQPILAYRPAPGSHAGRPWPPQRETRWPSPASGAHRTRLALLAAAVTGGPSFSLLDLADFDSGALGIGRAVGLLGTNDAPAVPTRAGQRRAGINPRLAAGPARAAAPGLRVRQPLPSRRCPRRQRRPAAGPARGARLGPQPRRPLPSQQNPRNQLRPAANPLTGSSATAADPLTKDDAAGPVSGIGRGVAKLPITRQNRPLQAV